MERISNEIIQQLFEGNSETRSLEYKSPFAWKNKKWEWIQLTLIKAIISMSNSRGGGKIIIGVSQDSEKKLDYKGLNNSQLNSFDDYENIKAIVDGFLYSPSKFEIVHGEINNKNYIIFIINEFSEIPLITKKEGSPIKKAGPKNFVIQKDMIYTRSLSSPFESTHAREKEFIELFRLTADKERYNLAQRGYVRQDTKNIQDQYDQLIKDLI